MNRIISVGRIQLINKWTYLGIPACIVGVAFVLSLVLFSMLPGDGPHYSPGAQYVLYYFTAIGAQAMALVFPFSQGLSLSRRAFYIGTLGVFGAVALSLSVIFYLMGLLETATNGWGMNGWMFNIPWITVGPWYQTIAFYFVAMVFFFIVGFWMTTVYKRWAATGMLVAGISIVAVLLAAALIINWQQWWPYVGAWFASSTSLSIAGWGAVLCAAMAVGSYRTLRKAAA